MPHLHGSGLASVASRLAQVNDVNDFAHSFSAARQNKPLDESHSLDPQTQVPVFTAEPSMLEQTGPFAHLLEEAKQNLPLKEWHSVVPH